MEQIIKAAMMVQSENANLDFLKADYLLTAKYLAERISYLIETEGFETEKDISYLTNHLIDAKEGLFEAIGAYIMELDNLSEEIENYLKYGNNGTDIFCEYCNDGRERCRECEVCTYDIEEYPREPTDAEIEAEIERQIAKSEAMADRM